MDYTERLEILCPLIIGIKEHGIRKDLFKLYRNMVALSVKLSIESVNCRRLHKPTATFIALNAQFNEQFSELEQWITFALLI